MVGMTLLVGVMCASCSIDEVASASRRVLVPQVHINQQVADGCTRFALKVAGGAVLIEALYNTNGCQSDDLRLEADTTPVYDAGTGTLRVPLVIRNIGTVPVVAPARVRFMADSTQFLNSQGQVIPGTPNIVATNYDTANTNGRVGQWRYDTLLTASGQSQILLPNAVSRRHWLEFSGSDLGQLVRIKLPTIGATASAVPMVAPDSVPQAVLQLMRADSNVAQDDAPEMAGRFPRNIVLVMFEPHATQGQREAAIAGVNGTVLGGIRIGTQGFYYVHLNGVSTTQELFTHILSLRSLPIVRLAIPDLLEPLSPAHRVPSNGPGFGAWRVTSSSILGSPHSPNWAQEAVGAPLAWGCTVGDPTVPIAVVDRWFAINADLYPNVLVPAPWSLSGSDHGTRVASVLAAVGNNGDGIAGLLWNAKLKLYDYGTAPAGTRPGYESFTALQRAGFDGARVINVSSGFGWLQLFNRLPTPTARDSAIVLDIANVFRQVLDSWNGMPHPPLVIVAASNDGVDAFWGGLPQVAVDSTYQARVVSVGSASWNGSLEGLSNRNTIGAPHALVEIAAPGDSVAVLDAVGTMT